MWITAAIFSAFFAGISSVLSKRGVKKIDSDVATAARTTVVFALAWAIALCTGAAKHLFTIGARSFVFLVLSGLATGASWLCYFKALSMGEASKVAAVDKSSVVFSVLFALLLFPEEREGLAGKLVCLAAIAVGTFAATDLRPGEKKRNCGWLFFALLSALFAAATSVLAKIGVEKVDSNLATAIRTSVVLLLSWLVVLGKGEGKGVKACRGREGIFLLLSGLATGASWIAYYYALRYGQVSVVVPIDKLSILVTVVFSVLALGERLSLKAWVGLALLTAGTVVMAVFP